MALQFVGSTSGVGTSTGYTVSLNGTLTGGIASSPSPGDIVLVVSAFGNTASSAPNVSGNNSGAYTGFQAAVHVNDTYDTEFRTFYEVQGSTVDTTLTVTRTTNTAYGGATVVMVYRGQNTATPFAQNSAYTTVTNGARAIPADATITAVGQIAISFGAGTQPSTGSAFTVPAALTGNKLSVKADGSTSDIGVWAADVTPTSTGTVTINAASGGTSNTSCSGAAHTIVLDFQPDPVIHDTSGSLTADIGAVSGSASSTTERTSSGTLTGQLGSVSGAADRQDAPVFVTHDTSGALAGQLGSVIGSTNRTHVFTASGALTGQIGSVSGAASSATPRLSSGVLTGQGSAVVGAATRFRAFTSSGVLAGQTAAISATADSGTTRTASGVLVGQLGAISGTASRSTGVITHATSGALTGQLGNISGTSSRTHVFTTSGALVGQLGSISGVATRIHEMLATGSLVGVSSVISGSAALNKSHATSGALVSQVSTLIGSASRTRIHTTSGTLSGVEAALVGYASRVGSIALTGEQVMMLTDIWRRLGLDATKPLTESDAQATFGNSVITKTGSDTIVSIRTGSDTPNVDVGGMVLDLWQRLGLDGSNALTISDSSISAGGVAQTRSKINDTTVTVTRT